MEVFILFLFTSKSVRILLVCSTGGAIVQNLGLTYNGVWDRDPREVERLNPWSGGHGQSSLKLRAFQQLDAQPRGKICSFSIFCKLFSKSKVVKTERTRDCLALSAVTFTWFINILEAVVLSKSANQPNVECSQQSIILEAVTQPNKAIEDSRLRPRPHSRLRK